MNDYTKDAILDSGYVRSAFKMEVRVIYTKSKAPLYFKVVAVWNRCMVMNEAQKLETAQQKNKSLMVPSQNLQVNSECYP